MNKIGVQIKINTFHYLIYISVREIDHKKSICFITMEDLFVAFVAFCLD